MEKIVYTLGYAHHTQESFLKLLKKYEINCVVDVRTMAYSRFHPQFNKEPLSAFLKSNQITYVHMDKEFGIIRTEETLNNKEGYLDFNKVACLPIFKSGIKRINKGVSKGYTICFICAEKNPCDCHRSTLVGRELSGLGYRVEHIRADGGLQTQKELEEEIVEVYCPKTNQIDLFQEETQDKRLEKAYTLCSNEIVEVNSKRVLKSEYKSPKTK